MELIQSFIFLILTLIEFVPTLHGHVLNYDSVTVCDGMAKQIQCPNDENIHVLQGFYGKWRNHDCKGESDIQDNYPTCSIDRQKTTAIAREICQGQNTCKLISDKSIFGEPCSKGVPYLYITFFCMAKGQKLHHQRTEANQEVVTVPSHGFVVQETKHLDLNNKANREKDKSKKKNILPLENPSPENHKLENPHLQPKTEKEKGKLVVSDKKNVTVINSDKINSELAQLDSDSEKAIKKQLKKTLGDNALNDIEIAFKKDNEATSSKDSVTTTNKDNNINSKTHDETTDMKKFSKAAAKKDREAKKDNEVLKKIENQLINIKNNNEKNSKKENQPTIKKQNTVFNNKEVDRNSTEATEKQENAVTEKKDNKALDKKVSEATDKKTQTELYNSEKGAKKDETIINDQGTILTRASLLRASLKTEDSAKSDKLTEVKEILNENREISSDDHGTLASDKSKKPIVEGEQVAKSDLPLSIGNKKKEKDDKRIRSSTICNGQSKLIACLPEEGIKINYAFYGKKSGRDCRGPLPYKDESPSCSALDAKSNVKSSCDGKQTCLLFADDNIYGKSLCPNVNKYLYLTYSCTPLSHRDIIPSKQVQFTPQEDLEEDAVSRSTEPSQQVNTTVKVCNGEKRTISCNHETMKITEAFFGKEIGRDCRGDLGYRDDIPECKNPRSLDSIKFLCENRKSCELAGESALFGDDICPGVNKYLTVTYSC